MSRWWKPLLVVGFVAAPLVSCGGENPFQAASSGTVVDTTVAGDGMADNDFLPEGEQLSACVGAVERPNCGSSAKGGWRQYLVLGVLLLGLTFIGWRIRKGVKARDAVVNSVSAATE